MNQHEPTLSSKLGFPVQCPFDISWYLMTTRCLVHWDDPAPELLSHPRCEDLWAIWSPNSPGQCEYFGQAMGKTRHPNFIKLHEVTTRIKNEAHESLETAKSLVVTSHLQKPSQYSVYPAGSPELPRFCHCLQGWHIPFLQISFGVPLRMPRQNGHQQRSNIWNGTKRDPHRKGKPPQIPHLCSPPLVQCPHCWECQNVSNKGSFMFFHMLQFSYFLAWPVNVFQSFSALLRQVSIASDLQKFMMACSLSWSSSRQCGWKAINTI